MQFRQCNVKIDCEQLPRCIETFNIWFLEPWSNYYFLGGGGRPDYLQKLKVPEGYEKMIDYSNI